VQDARPDDVRPPPRSAGHRQAGRAPGGGRARRIPAPELPADALAERAAARGRRTPRRERADDHRVEQRRAGAAVRRGAAEDAVGLKSACCRVSANADTAAGGRPHLPRVAAESRPRGPRRAPAAAAGAAAGPPTRAPQFGQNAAPGGCPDSRNDRSWAFSRSSRRIAGAMVPESPTARIASASAPPTRQRIGEASRARAARSRAPRRPSRPRPPGLTATRSAPASRAPARARPAEHQHQVVEVVDGRRAAHEERLSAAVRSTSAPASRSSANSRSSARVAATARRRRRSRRYRRLAIAARRCG